MNLDEKIILDDLYFFSLLRFKYMASLCYCLEYQWDNFSCPNELIVFLEAIRRIERNYDLKAEYENIGDEWFKEFNLLTLVEKKVINHLMLNSQERGVCIQYSGYQIIRQLFIKYRIFQESHGFILWHLFLKKDSFYSEMIEGFNRLKQSGDSGVIHRIQKACRDMEKLFYRYGQLEVISINFHFPNHSVDEVGYDRFIRNIKPILEKVQLSLHGDQRLVKGYFKLEDDGQYGLRYSCILIYPKEAKVTKQVIENQLKPLIEMTNVRMDDWGRTVDQIAGKRVSGAIEHLEDLHNFCHWHLGFYYLYDFYFSLNPVVQNRYALKINHIESHEWNIDLLVTQEDSDRERVIQYHTLQNYSADSNVVWKVDHLPEAYIQKHQYLEVFVNEIDLSGRDLDSKRVLQYLEIFNDTLLHSDEPFFKFDIAVTTKKKNQIRVTRLGNQFLFLYKYFKQRNISIENIQMYNTQRGGVLSQLLSSNLWHKVLSVQEPEAQYETHSIFLNQKKLSYFNDVLRNSGLIAAKERFGGREISYAETDSEAKKKSTEKRNILYFIKQTEATTSYVKSLFKHDSFVTRVQFYCTSLKDLDFFSKNLTEFLRVYKRKPLLKGLKGYFLVWLLGNDGLPFVDMIFILEYSKNYENKEFIIQLDKEWKAFNQGKVKLETVIAPQVREDTDLSFIIPSLRQRFVAVEASDRKLKQDIYHTIVPFFTFRHFFLAVNVNKKKLFSKGSAIKSK
ncbi:hypothetical protein [Acinetobacter sp. WCHA39]|uniref:hypothetical protein n=1 Tax=Acinetobacter sp. WCHA39 TaxID=2004648 RepID=UPI000B3BF709|nr:hypothetical protein [Acinetobacter sp. WCHA39]